MGKEFGYVGEPERGSPLNCKELTVGSCPQSQGHAIGHGTGREHGKAAHHPHMGTEVEPMIQHVKNHPQRGAHGYGQSQRGFLRGSGHPGAHQVGKR